MANIVQDIYDWIQDYKINSNVKKTYALDFRVSRLEKLVYELCLEIQKMKLESQKQEKESIEDVKKTTMSTISNNEFHLDDRILMTKDIIYKNKTIKQGTKGVIDNRLSSISGVLYIIKLDDGKTTIQVSDDCFELDR